MAAITPTRPYHIIIFGATGFTGQFVVEEVARCAAESTDSTSLKWAVAGRSRQRLEEVLKQAAGRLCMCLRGCTGVKQRPDCLLSNVRLAFTAAGHTSYLTEGEAAVRIVVWFVGGFVARSGKY